MVSNIKILSGDPGKIRDSFFIVGTEIKQNKLYVRLAVQRTGKAYKQVCAEFAELSRKHNFKFNLIEANNTGQFVIEELQQVHHIPVIGVTTTKDIKDEKKKGIVEKMDKNENVKWFLNMKAEHRIIFPVDKKCSPAMLELKRQIAIFAEHRTEAGTVSYYAPGEEHDDGVMALMINIQKVKQYLKPGGQGGHVIGQVPEYRQLQPQQFMSSTGLGFQ
jgi:hypothetical protein